VPPRVKAYPFLTLMAVVSAILIVVGRVNKDMWCGNWVFVARHTESRWFRRSPTAARRFDRAQSEAPGCAFFTSLRVTVR
jgi:hypothetical protein